MGNFAPFWTLRAILVQGSNLVRSRIQLSAISSYFSSRPTKREAPKLTELSNAKLGLERKEDWTLRGDYHVINSPSQPELPEKGMSSKARKPPVQKATLSV
jgi:hypothetical protein